MKYFVISYNRRTGHLGVEEFLEGKVALRRRFELEGLRTDPDLEIGYFGSESLDTLKVTHARYFRSVGEIASAGVGS